jgi:AraC-like DNA-binding protein
MPQGDLSVLEPVEDADAYFRDPRWKILRRQGFVCSSPDGRLLSLWGVGHADVEGVVELLEIYAAVERAHFPPRRQLVVLRHLQSVTTAAMARFVRYHEQVTTYLKGVTHEAVVRPGGVVGVFAEGFYRAVPHPAEGRVFSSLDDAAAFAGVTDEPWLRAMLAEEQRMLVALQQRPEGLDALWAPHYMRLTLADAARSLGLSPRTLQRRLGDLGTPFETLRLRASLDHAESLRLTGRDVKEVAFTLGFASPSAFSTAFRRARGCSSEQWRATHARP